MDREGPAAAFGAGEGTVVVADDDGVAVEEAEIAGGAGHGPMMHGGCDRERVPSVPNLQVSVHIRASPEQVWSVVEDIAGHSRWMLDAAAIRFTSARRHGVGTTFDCDTRLGPIRFVDHMEVTEWRPRRAMGVTHRGLVAGTGRFTIRRRWPGRTRFTWEERLVFPWWFGGPAGAVAAKPVLRRVWHRSLRNLKELIEDDGRAGA